MNTLQKCDLRRAGRIPPWLSILMALAYFIGALFCLTALNAAGQTTGLNLAWDASPDPNVAGYTLYYGPAGAGYSSSVDSGTTATVTITGLDPELTYYFAVVGYNSDGVESASSNVITNGPPVDPSIASQPMAQTALAGTPVTLSVIATGAPPLSFQWMDGASPVAGGTTSALNLASVGVGDSGNYAVVVTSPWGVAISSNAALTVLAPPSIIQQPQSQTVAATAPASLSCAVTGTAPFSFHWYLGTKAVSGATNSTLAWASIAAANAGNYQCAVSNFQGVVTSAVATLTVASSTMFKAAAGAYNGLFFQTNTDGTPAVTVSNAGFLGNCVVAANGVFSAKLYLGGQSYPCLGNFSATGSNATVILQTNGNATGLVATLQLNSANGAGQITGVVSGTAAGNLWSSPLVAIQSTNALPKMTALVLIVPQLMTDDGPINPCAILGTASSGVLTLSGALGDTTTFSQSVPVGNGGYVPVYGSLYNGAGLLEGWIQLGGGQATGDLTWIRPSGITLPPGYPDGFDIDTVVAGVVEGN